MADTTNCENCSREITLDEVQMCEHCGMDGLGNCCIGVADHGCEAGRSDNSDEAPDE